MFDSCGNHADRVRKKAYSIRGERVRELGVIEAKTVSNIVHSATCS
jgi:hypothetical protein